jgi:hypothetical protein
MFEMREVVKRVCSDSFASRVKTSGRQHTAVSTHFICETPGFARYGWRDFLQSSHEMGLRNSGFF